MPTQIAAATLADAAGRLRALHVPGRPLVLPNAWDVTSAQLVASAGFPVVATTSSAVAASLGFEDGGTAPPADVFAAVRRIAAAVSVPVTADIEDGYGLAADDLVDALLGAGAVGCNLEDSDHSARPKLVPADGQANRIAEVKAAARERGVDLVLNARIDVFLRGKDDSDALVAEVVRRAKIYLEAGADCVYPIMALDIDVVARFVPEVTGPVNVLASIAEPQLSRLAALGVARISFGSGLAEAANQTVVDVLGRLAAG